jgi:hypothetical protein
MDWFSIDQTENTKKPIDMDWFSIDQTESTKRPIDMDWFSIDQTESTKRPINMNCLIEKCPISICHLFCVFSLVYRETIQSNSPLVLYFQSDL